MKRKQLLFAMMLYIAGIFSMNVYAENFEDDNIKWVQETGALTVKTNTGATSNIFTPYFVEKSGADKTDLKNLTINEGVTEIGNNSFSGCVNLTGTITFPSSMASIGESSFSYTGITAINWGNSTGIEVKYLAFLYSNLTGSLTIPTNVTSIGYAVFNECKNLTSVTFEGAPTIITFPSGSDSGIFQGCTSLLSIDFGSMTKIPVQTLKDCTSLATVTMVSVEEIEAYAFENCSNLEAIDLSNVTTLGNYTFSGCTSLATVTGLSNVRIFSAQSFKDCAALTSVDVRGAESLVSTVFAGCTGITSVTLPGPYTINAVANETNFGSVNIRPRTTTSLNISATANSGYKLKASPDTWAQSGTVGNFNSSFSQFLNIGENVTLTANFELLPSGYDVTLTVNKDGNAYASHGKTFALNQSGTSKYTGTGTDGTVTFSSVDDGTYDIYDGTTDTGVDVTVSGAVQTATVNYYTVQFAVSDVAPASGSTISATYDGTTITSGNVVVGGKTLVITAVGAGGSNYSYAWTGTGTNSETTATLTKENLAGAVNATCTVTGSKQSQTINFDALSNVTVGDADFAPGATASSGLTVSYASSNTNVATIVDGKIHIVAAGTTTITASQAGNDEYEAATDVTQELTVVKKSQIITFNALANVTVGDADFAPSATASSGLTVSYASSNTNVATIVDGKIHIIAAGTTTITASQAGNDEYKAATNVTQELTVNSTSVVKQPQTITFGRLANVTVGSADFSPGATASSGLEVSYTSSNTNVATIVNGKIHIIAAGTTTITASQAGNDEYEAAADVTQTLTAVYAPVLSSDATLSDLEVSEGTLAPLFSSTITSYTVTVEYDIEEITIQATANDRYASVSGAGIKPLSEGVNTFDIVVTAEDGTRKTYTVEITRKTNPVGNEEINVDPTKIYLNAGILYIDTPDVIKRVTIYSFAGAIVYNQTNATNTINVSALIKGTYIVKLTTAKGEVTRKVMKQ
ncbi:hypothetical protein M2137_001876 [Parabacteroides sp. PFB2-10]|uniref:leucine-rich repeat protein n=1 Tax=Parabacteroides sp. PFB2-10 TaxID=1742405 RepID=UPI0024764E0D|nr:leucine-rich repeat protein [Parabacteroides sp. PFB2-10]MDH6313089.1 hypothetical protein [Parabacteroides sp. PFB2-10]MDL2215177.1 leucine-rich repeat protein [Dysgonomonas sp. OttesenSCG-928-M03]MDL2244950.1 leucine-rich repeat protein [Parabacteroides sp. OttesenSCG-928-J18]MDL2282004.1 leucine-rich repeat protein [Parabacteroides sp. OttesenSCG-928-G06]